MTVSDFWCQKFRAAVEADGSKPRGAGQDKPNVMIAVHWADAAVEEFLKRGLADDAPVLPR